MKLSPVILLFEPAYAEDPRRKTAMRLRAHGFEVVHCAELLKLYRVVKKNSRQTGLVVLVMLSGSLADNCIAAKYLRTLYPPASILALVCSLNDSVLLRTLESGADSYCRRNASTGLLLATVFRLLGRSGKPADMAHDNASPAESLSPANWILLEHGWILGGPQGLRIPLTTGERSFLTTLFAAPDLRASHCQLIKAVNASYDLPSPSIHQARLGVMVSRLRGKFREHGISMPLKSVHNWGYMFTGPVAP